MPERSKLREMGSLMKLIGLKVSSGEKVFVTVEGLSAETPAENLEQAADSMCELLESDSIKARYAQAHPYGE